MQSLGAFKFQQAVNKEMLQSEDHFRHIINDDLTSSQRRSKKAKKNFFHIRDKLKERQSNPEEFASFQQNLKDKCNTPTAVVTKNKQPVPFVLNVSSSSSDCSSQGSPEFKEQKDAKGQVNKLVKKSPVQIQMRKQTISKQLKQRKDVEFVKSLAQNQEFKNNEIISLTEYKIDNEIYIDMDCKDFLTFTRLQHEVDEMRRKQMDFNAQKERHYKELLKVNQPEEHAKEENKFYAVIMAKKFASKLQARIMPKQTQSVDRRRKALLDTL